MVMKSMAVAALVIAELSVPAAIIGRQHPFNERPADVTVIMSTSRKKYDGTYRLSEVARVCGEVPKELNFAGVPSFLVQLYPDSGQGEVQDVTFSSNELVGGVTTSTKFHLSVLVKSPVIGAPAAYVLDTKQPKMTGTARLTYPKPGTVQLKVDGVNDRGETVDLTLVCKPRTASGVSSPAIVAGRR